MFEVKLDKPMKLTHFGRSAKFKNYLSGTYCSKERAEISNYPTIAESEVSFEFFKVTEESFPKEISNIKIYDSNELFEVSPPSIVSGIMKLTIIDAYENEEKGDYEFTYELSGFKKDKDSYQPYSVLHLSGFEFIKDLKLGEKYIIVLE